MGLPRAALASGHHIMLTNVLTVNVFSILRTKIIYTF